MQLPWAVLASIPSPSRNSIDLGPLELRAYGVMIALGVLAAVWIASRRWEVRGGDEGEISAVAMWAVPGGLVGARLYHVATDWHRFEGRWAHVVAVWEGGLGIPGGIAGGVLVGVLVARRRGMAVLPLLDAVAPALPVAQAIGRLGNWFNQELFGRPSDAPWALRIDESHRPDGYADVATYHPTFLYEALWNLALAALLVWIGRRWRLRPGQLFGGYVAGYALGRLWVESLRIDAATEVLGLRINLLVSLVLLVGATAVLVIRRGPGADEGGPDDPGSVAGGGGEPARAPGGGDEASLAPQRTAPRFLA